MISEITMSIIETKSKFKNKNFNLLFCFKCLTKFVSYCTIIMEKGSVIMNDKITLTANDILEKEFKIDARGYRLQEVDKFLDIIIKDYTEYDKLLRKYNTELKAVLEENTKLKNEIRNLKSTLSVAEGSSGQTNLDILRRLGELEKIVYGEE